MKKIGVICLALVLALGSMGVGYALWSDSLYLEGTINTGEVDTEIISIASDDVGIDPGYDKHVATTEVAIIDSKTATITVTNGYPSYSNWVHFTTAILGTVPVRLQAINIVNPNQCITVDAWNGIGEQRHPGDFADNTLRFHIEQCSEQGGEYTFTVEFFYVQYNEY